MGAAQVYLKKQVSGSEMVFIQTNRTHSLAQIASRIDGIAGKDGRTDRESESGQRERGRERECERACVRVLMRPCKPARVVAYMVACVRAWVRACVGACLRVCLRACVLLFERVIE